jgi:predicted  nucleic acid-binding Zn-ribbon protein
MASCVWTPKKGGQTFKDAQKEIGRDNAKVVYHAASDVDFRNENKNVLVYEDGFPTYDSLKRVEEMNDFITLKKGEWQTKNSKVYEDTLKNTKALVNQAIEYNKSNKDLVALVDYSDGGIKLTYVVPTTENIQSANIQRAILKLNEQAADMLSEAGITIEHLLEGEALAGKVGVTEFNKSQDKLESYEVMIRVANNLKGSKAISEEFAHTIVGIYRDDNIVSRSLKHLMNNTELIAAILGDKYDAYNEEYGGNINALAEEALGHILQDMLIQKSMSMDENAAESSYELNSPILQRAAKKVIGKFGNIDANDFHNAINFIQSDIGELATKIIKKEVTVTQDQIQKARRIAAFNALTGKVKKQIDAIEDAITRDMKESSLLFNYEKDEDSKDPSLKRKSYLAARKKKNSLARYKNAGESVAATVDFIKAALDDMKDFYKTLQNIDELSEQDKFRLLRNVQTHLDNYGLTLKDLNQFTLNEFINDPEIGRQAFVVGQLIDEVAQYVLKNIETFDSTTLNLDELEKVIGEQSEDLNLSDDESHYVDSHGNKYKRVTSIISAIDNISAFNKDSLYYTPSTNIGTGIDEMNRSVINGKLKKEGADWKIDGKLAAEVFPNVTQEAANKYLDFFSRKIESIRKQGITLIEDEVTLNGLVDLVDQEGNVNKLGVAGTVDMIGYDANGNWYIYDFKTHHGEIKDDHKKKWTAQLSMYKKMLSEKYNVDLDKITTKVLPISVKYDTPNLNATRNNPIVEYTVLNSNADSSYTGKKNNQLLKNGVEFKEADPYLEDEIDINYKESELDYESVAGVKYDESYINGAQQMVQAIKDLHSVYSQLEGLFSVEKFRQLSKYLEGIFGEYMIMPDPNEPGGRKNVKIEEILKNADSDVSGLTAWLTSMADSPDLFLQMLDSVYKRKMTEKRLKLIETSQNILALGKKYEAMGITNYDFMFNSSKKTYVSKEYSMRDFLQAKDTFYKYLDDKYGKDIKRGDERFRERQQELAAWLKENTTDGQPKPEKFPSEYESWSQAQKDFYDEWMEMKKDLDDLLPPGTTTYLNTIKIRKDFIERIKNTDDNAIQSWIDNVRSGVKKSFDDDVLYNRITKTEFSGEERMSTPLLYVNNGGNHADVSTDVIGTLVAYADMALQNAMMEDIVHQMEIAKNVARDRRILKQEGKYRFKELFGYKGNTISSPVYENTTNTNFWKQLNSFLETKIYGRKIKDSGEFMGVDINKAATKALKLGSVVQLGFNVFAQSSSVATGITMQNIEAVSQQHFKAKTLAKADAEFGKAIVDYCGDIGQRIKKSKLHLFDDMFNVRQNYNGKGVNFKNRNILLRIFGPHLQYLGQDAGDTWLYNRTALAIALETKVMKNGQEMNLWEALETVDIDSAHPEYGKKLSYDGITNLDGSEFSMENIHEISQKIGQINRHLFGIYNEEDRVMARQYILGCLGMQYRDWMPSQFMYRFGKKKTEIAMGKDENGDYKITEGYYRTAYNFTKGLVKDLRNGKINIMTEFRRLDTYDQENIKKALFEVSNFIAVSIAAAVLMGIVKGMDKDKRPWALAYAAYMLQRQKTELGVLVPGPQTALEGVKILRSPIANMSVTQKNIEAMIALMNPFGWTDEIKSGEYKGHSSNYRALANSSLTLWMKNIERASDPIKAAQFYK